jgi:hypothetical protein
MPALRQSATDVLVLRGSPVLGEDVNLASRLEGLTVAREGSWRPKSHFRHSPPHDPSQKLYALYRARCATFRIEPPAPDWDGANQFAVK